MAGLGEVLAVLALLEPAFSACTKTYGFYKLTKGFGEDYKQAERGLRGQMARLTLIGDTRIQDLMSVPEDGTQLAATTIWTLGRMRNNFELCESLMKKYGEPKAESSSRTRSLSTSSHTFSLISTRDSPQTPAPDMTQGKKSKNVLFSRRHRPSSSASSVANQSTSSSVTETSPSSTTSPSSFGSLNDPRVLKGIQNDSLQATNLQTSSTIFERLKWVSEDRKRFFTALEDLNKANDLLESLLRIKAPDDPTFLPSGVRLNNTTVNFLASTKATLESLHNDLLSINPQSGRDVEFSLKLVLDGADKDIYTDYVDTDFDESSSVFSLQAHSKSFHGKNQKSLYLLAETPTSADVTAPVITNLLSPLKEIDPDAEPNFHCLGLPDIAHSRSQQLRIYQDQTSEWHRTRTLADALKDQIFQDISFQRHYSQLGLFVAFSYAVLPVVYRGAQQFPQPANYTYYDQISTSAPSPGPTPTTATSISANEPFRQDRGGPGTPLITVDDTSTDSGSHYSSTLDPDAAFQELQSPYLSFHFGARRSTSTKALGKRAGFTAVAHNPVVALGLVLYQIGSWQHLATGGEMVQMRSDALERPQDLIRLSGVEFADIARTCLNWRETGGDGRHYDSEDMLVRVYARLDEYNKSLQALM